MDKYSWGIDGFDRAHIDFNGDRVIILCVIPGCSIWECIYLLENN